MSNPKIKTTEPIIDKDYDNDIHAQLVKKIDGMFATFLTSLSLGNHAMTKLQLENVFEQQHYEALLLLRKLPN